MDPLEGTLFKVNVHWLNPELTHFSLVVRPRKVQQSALPFISLFVRLCRPFAPRLSQPYACEAVLNCRKPSFSLMFKLLIQHTAWQLPQAGARFPGVVICFFWWLSCEVEHVVHLIHLNLNRFNAHAWVVGLPSLDSLPSLSINHVALDYSSCVLAGTADVEFHGTTACDLFTLDHTTFPSTTKLTDSWSTTHGTSKQLWPLRKVANAENSLTPCSTNYLNHTSHQRRHVSTSRPTKRW